MPLLQRWVHDSAIMPIYLYRNSKTNMTQVCRYRTVCDHCLCSTQKQSFVAYWGQHGFRKGRLHWGQYKPRTGRTGTPAPHRPYQYETRTGHTCETQVKPRIGPPAPTPALIVYITHRPLHYNPTSDVNTKFSSLTQPIGLHCLRPVMYAAGRNGK